MKKKIIQISIPQPCNMVFENMPIVKRERHCQKCDKQIMDFSMQSDRAIIATYKANNGKICGRFRADQLDRNILLEPKLYQNTRWKAFGLMLSGFLSVGTMKGQVSSNQMISQIEQLKEKVDSSTFQAVNPNITTLKGIVTDDKKNPIADVLLTTNLNIKTTTDSLGHFSFQIEASKTPETLIIKLEKGEFNPKYKVISKSLFSKTNSFHIKLKKANNHTFQHSSADDSTILVDDSSLFFMGAPIVIDSQDNKKGNQKEHYKYEFKPSLEQNDFILKAFRTVFSNDRIALTLEAKKEFDGFIIFRTKKGEEIIFKTVNVKKGENTFSISNKYLKALSNFKIELISVNEVVLAAFEIQLME